MRISLSLVCLLLVSACATTPPTVKLYDGKERADQELLTVSVPVELEILSINDRRVEGAGTMFAYDHRDLKLLPGQYRIAAYYKNLFQLSADQHEVVKSDPALFTLDGKAGESWALNFDKPADVEAARTLARDFEGWSENLASGERRDSTPSGLILNQGFIGLATAETATAPAAVSSVSPESTATSQADTANGDQVLDTLKQNWKSASPEQRREFLLWMSQ